MLETLTGPALYALSQGAKCEGPQKCYWCSAPCSQLFTHDERPPILGQRTKPTARIPGSAFLCIGCWLFRRKRITAQFLNGSYLDLQCPQLHSWWITAGEAWSLRRMDAEHIFPLLLSPPKRFSLSIIDGKQCITNDLHRFDANNFDGIVSQTELTFSFNNGLLSYSTYELEEALQNGSTGKSPGVRTLLAHFGTFKLLGRKKPDGRGCLGGAEERSKSAKKAVVASGSAA